MSTTSFEHNGHTVTLTDDFRFRVDGPLFPNNADPQGYGRTYGTAQEARDKIDERQKAHEKANRIKLSIPVLLPTGKRATITGIHATRLVVLGIDNKNHVYPDNPWLLSLIRRHAALQIELRRIATTLAKYAIHADGQPDWRQPAPRTIEEVAVRITANASDAAARALADQPKEAA